MAKQPKVRSITPAIRIKFIITDFDCSEDELTKELGVVPTKSWAAGEPVYPKMWIERKTAGWMLESPGLARNDGFDEQLRVLLDVLEKRADVIRRLAKRATARIYCTFDEGTGPAGLKVDPSVMTRLVKLGLTLELDF